MAAPLRVRRQLAELEALMKSGHRPTREECEERFPGLVAYINEHLSLVDLMRADGIKLTPLSPDAPVAYIAEGACPCCGGDIMVKE